MEGLNRSACRSDIKVSSTHHRVGMILLSPLPRGSVSGDVKDYGEPRRVKGWRAIPIL
jgi:hypothetical protein